MPVLLNRMLRLAACVCTVAGLGCDEPLPEDAMQGSAVPDTLLGRAMTVTLLSSNNERAAVPGTVAVYRFLSDTRVLGDGHQTLTTSSWTWDAQADDRGFVHLQYDSVSFEEYTLNFTNTTGGTCTFYYEAGYIGGGPNGETARRFDGTCEFSVDTSCADVPDATGCEMTGVCQWDARDPALAVCVPKPVLPEVSCPDYAGPVDAPQRDAQCKAAWAAECGGVPKEPYCEIYNHPTWGSAGSCPHCS